jgi:3-deoxy-7-phosphoheptulonate synthase
MKALRAVPRPWSPASWRRKPAAQQPSYPDPGRVEEVMDVIARLPPLVTSWEVEALREQLAAAARGEAFLLQGGDCAESFEDCRSEVIANKLKILLQMSLVLVYGTRRRVVRVGRIAGQYAKPRSEDSETLDGVTLPAYRGDLVNRPPFTPRDRTPDPELMLRGYERAALTLNFIRALTEGGFADLHHPEYWDLDFLDHSPLGPEYRRMADAIHDSIRFMETLSGDIDAGDVSRVDFFTGHEGLHLPYEQAQTRQVPHRPGWYNLASHMPWIGMRTNDPDGAHAEYFRGIRNPVGVKVGAGMPRERLLRLIEVLCPEDEPGRLTLIHRFGADRIGEELPALLDGVARSGRAVVFCCDPMHGNTETTAAGYKTRRFENIVSELEQAIAIHGERGTHLGGVHFELTGDDVTECIGGARGLSEVDLARAYRSQVDPRLNYEQALELAMVIARRIRHGGEAAG